MRTPGLAFVALFAAATLVACPTGGGGAGAPVIASFTASPSALPFGGGSATLNYSVAGATSLAIDQGVGDVTGTTSKVVSLTTTKTFTLTATNAQGSVTAHAAVTTPATGTVSGHVIDLYFKPVSGRLVTLISGGSATSVSPDASGAFTLSNVAAPYTVAVVDVAGKKVTVYEGLTRPDPTLTDFAGGGSGLPANSATITGQVTGGAFAPSQPADHTTGVSFASPDTIPVGGSATTAANGTYSISSGQVSWDGAAATTGTLYALQWQHDTVNNPTDYTGYGRLSGLTVTNGATFAGKNVALSPVAHSNLTGTYTPPDGYTVTEKQLIVRVDDRAFINLASVAGSATSLGFLTPNLPGSTIVLGVAAGSAGNSVQAYRTGLAPNASGVTITAPAGSGPLSPADTATGVTTATPFSWSPLQGGIHAVSFTGAAGQPSFTVVTAGTSAMIPNLSALGLGLAASASYQWSVQGLGPLASVDALAAPGGELGWLLGVLNARTPTDLVLTSSATRTFTTSP